MLVSGVQLRAIYMAVLGHASSLIYDLSHNFAGYVINTAGLEYLGCWFQIARWLQEENFEKSI